jgi:hypothetical protein
MINPAPLLNSTHLGRRTLREGESERERERERGPHPHMGKEEGVFYSSKSKKLQKKKAPL